MDSPEGFHGQSVLLIYGERYREENEVKAKNVKKLRKLMSIALVLCLVMSVVSFIPNESEAAQYTLDGQLLDQAGSMPGVYTVTANVGDSVAGSTIGVSSISKQTLQNNPTTESPAIIMGAAVNYETKTGPTEYTPIPGATLKAPYEYFRWNLMTEQRQEADGSITTHNKLSGFDGSYYIVRVDVSNIIGGFDQSAESTKYLHVNQSGNTALIVSHGMNGTTFADGMGNKTGSYSLRNNAASLKDTTGDYANTPYIDVIVLASNKLVAGSETGSATAPNGDFTLSFYVDDTEDYNPSLVYDPASTDPNHNASCLKKFYADQPTGTVTGYTVKGSDLEIDCTVDDRDVTGEAPEFWSLTKAIGYQNYDSHTIKLISEVPVLEGISVSSPDGRKRTVILDVNSFDIEIANDNQSGAAGLTIFGNSNLILMDSSRTSGAELAVGNNATMYIEEGGVLTIDESCVVEAEYDAATVMPGQVAPTLVNGEIIVKSGGKMINNGVINIEGTEGKPTGVGENPVRDMRPASIIVQPNGVLENNGGLSLKGNLYVLGTLINNGRYNDVITKSDPDKGNTDYHRGIQITWKDDVTQAGVIPGTMFVGMDADGRIYNDANVINNGDILIAPGRINLYGTLDTTNGHVYLADVTEAIIPVELAENPLIKEQRIALPKTEYGLIKAYKGSKIIGTEANFSGATVELLHNGVLGAITDTGEAKNHLELIEEAEVVQSANDGVRDLVRDVDFTVRDGDITFTQEYLDSIKGQRRTIRMNFGYRFIYFDVAKIAKNPKTGDK